MLEPSLVWSQGAVHAGWTVTVSGERIVRVGPAARHNDVRVPLPGCVLVPGLVNAHSHAFQRAIRGHVQWRRTDRDDFWTWREAMYARAATLTPEGMEAVARLAFLEMLEGGITHVGEFHYVHHQPDGSPYDDPDELARRVIAAALHVGVRITLLRVVYARSGPGQPLQGAQRRFGDRGPEAALRAVERLASPDPRVRVGLAPHSVRAVPVEWLRALSAYRGTVHAHVAEQPAEVQACRAEHGASPLQVFARAGLVSDRFTAVHLTFPDDGDLERLVEADATVCACPTTEQDLGDGFLPLSLRAARLCVGTDSHARVDLFDEVRALEWHARALAGRRVVMAPRGSRHALAARLLDIGTRGGGRALGVPVGDAEGIAEGMAADLVAIDLDRPSAVGVPPLEAVVFGANPEWVRAVWVGGAPVVQDGRHPDRDAIIAAARPWCTALE